MKFTRTWIVFIAMIMASSQVLAAVCSISCAGLVDNTHQQTFSVGMADMDMTDCHDTNSSQDQQSSKHVNCSMMGCHSSQLLVLDMGAKGLAPVLSNAALPQFISIAITADQPPPIKPPA